MATNKEIVLLLFRNCWLWALPVVIFSVWSLHADWGYRHVKLGMTKLQVLWLAGWPFFEIKDRSDLMWCEGWWDQRRVTEMGIKPEPQVEEIAYGIPILPEYYCIGFDKDGRVVSRYHYRSP